MNDTDQPEYDASDWLEAKLQDTLDEDYELELSEPALSLELRRIYQRKHPETLPREVYFRSLIGLQAELIKLQDWVEHTRAKIAVIFEGRDSAGKGGVIKRVRERLNPRHARVVALGGGVGLYAGRQWRNLADTRAQAACRLAGIEVEIDCIHPVLANIDDAVSQQLAVLAVMQLQRGDDMIEEEPGIVAQCGIVLLGVSA
mgnify:CR=1 FL=1